MDNLPQDIFHNLTQLEVLFSFPFFLLISTTEKVALIIAPLDYM